jgi:hypothetical protein
MKKIFLLIFLLHSASFAFSQKGNSNKENIEKIEDAIKLHKELDVDDAENGYKVFPVGNQGLVLAYMPDGKASNGMQDFIFKKLDINFKEDFKTKITIKKTYSIIDYQQEGDFLYFLFSKDGNNHGNTFLTDPYFKDYLLVKLNTNTKEVKTTPGLFDKTFHFKQMLVNNGVVILGGKVGPSQGDLQTAVCLSAALCYIPLIFYTPTYKPYVAKIDMNNKGGSKKEYLMENYGKGLGDLVDMDVSDSTDEISFTVKHKLKKISKLSMRAIKSGKITADIAIKTPPNIEIYKGKFNIIDSERKLMVGAYGPITGMKSGTGNITQGIYVGLFDNNKQKYFKLIPWNKFKGFKVKTTKSEANAMKKSAKKGVDAKILMQVIFHDVLVREDEMVFFGESYYPKYETHTETYYSNGRLQTRTVTVFVGYQYAGAMIFAVNEAGDLLWDNGLNINGPLSFNLKERFKFYETGDNQYTVIYNEGFKLRAQTVDKESDENKIREVTMESNKKGDKISYYENSSDIEYWFDDYYLATGRQDIKNKKEKGKNKKRNIFYLNKIELPAIE